MKPYDMTKHLPKKGTSQPMNRQPIPNRPQQINIDLNNSIPQKCKICECPVFITGVQLHIVSALISPTGQELLAQAPCFLCANCKSPYGATKEVLND